MPPPHWKWVRLGNVERLQRLVEQDPAVLHEYSGQPGGTMLMYAARWCRLACAEYLLDKGAGVNDTDDRGVTALVQAIIRPYEKTASSIVELLLNRGADASLADNEGLTALHHSAVVGLDSVVDILLRWGVDVDAVGGQPAQSALGRAMRAGHHAVVARLLHAGADPPIMHPTVVSAAQGSATGGYELCVKHLQDWGRPYVLTKARRVHDACAAFRCQPSGRGVESAPSFMVDRVVASCEEGLPLVEVTAQPQEENIDSDLGVVCQGSNGSICRLVVAHSIMSLSVDLFVDVMVAITNV